MKLKMKTGNYILGCIGIVGGILIVILAFVQDLDFTSRGLPGPGFFPVMCGGAIVVCSALLMLENYNNVRRAKGDEGLDKDMEKNLVNLAELRSFVLLIGVSWAVILLTSVLGLLICLMLAVIFLIKFMGRESWKTALLVGVGTTVVLYGIFNLFLGVPMPTGILGI